MASLRPELERIIGDAVRSALSAKTTARTERALVPSEASSLVRLPIRIRSDEDARELIRWFMAICSCTELRQLFLDGSIEIDVSVGNATPAESSSGAKTTATSVPTPTSEAHAKTLNEPVVTEAVLRRSTERGEHLIVAKSAVITPTAQDYAKSAGIRIERSAK